MISRPFGLYAILKTHFCVLSLDVSARHILAIGIKGCRSVSNVSVSNVLFRIFNAQLIWHDKASIYFCYDFASR